MGRELEVIQVLATIMLVAATVAVGLIAGLLAAFSYAVMPGLRRADARTVVTAMQRINEAIVNPVFLVIFIGAPVLTALAVGLHLPADRRAALPWLVAALLLYGVALLVTAARNVPLNNQLAAAGSADRTADLPAVRAQFERPWVRWNLVRTLVCTAAFACLAVALAESA